MSWGAVCWIISTLIFFVLALTSIVTGTWIVKLELIAAGLVPLGLLLSGYSLPDFPSRKAP